MNSTLMNALGWTLIHSLWQCAAIGILFAASNLALRRASANLRYILSYSTLLAMPAAAITTFFALFSHHDLSAALPASMPVLSRIATEHLSSASIAPSSHRMPYLTLVVWFWLAGVVMMSIWSATGWFIAQRLKRRSKHALPEIWQSRLAVLAEQFGIRRGIRLCESTLAKVPAVIGWIRPVILIPAGALISLSAQELEAVLAHELAHIRRFDYVANLLQSAIEALMFYHPAMWWVAKRIRAERENCCDDLAIAACGDRVTYARALTALEELRSGYPPFAMAATGGNLLSRVRRMLGKDDPRSRSLPVWLALATVLIAGLVVTTGIRLHAQSNPPAPPVPPAPAAVQSIPGTPRAPVAPVPPSEPADSIETPAPRAFTPPPASSACFGYSACGEAMSPDAPSVGYGASTGSGEAGSPSASFAPGASASSPAPFAAVGAYSIAAAAGAPPQSAPAAANTHRDGYLAGLVEAGYTQISVDDIIALRDNGVDPKYIQGMLRAGLGTPSPQDLINLHNHGVSPEYARKAVAAGIPSLNVERIIHLAENGVDLDCVQRIHALGFGPFPVDQLIELHNNGVPSSLFEALKESGYTIIDARQAVEAQQNGLTAKSLRNLREQGFKGLTFEQVVKLCRAGVI
jgi:beta-lactamase regulating signal transducer with metallopeptidase domain